MSKRNFTPEQDLQLANEYEAGASYRDLARKYGGTDPSVRAAVRRGGGQSRRRTLKVPRPGWKPVDILEITRLYREGESVRELARRYRCRTAHISDVLADQDVVLKPGGRAHPTFRTLAARREVAEAYQAGASLKELAARYNCSVNPIKKALQEVGVDSRPPGVSKTWTPETIEWAVEQYQQGRSQDEIASELGVSQTAVSRRLRSAGMQINAPLNRRSWDHGAWKGGRILSRGYAWKLADEADLPYGTPNSSGYIAEHRLVMGRALGRPLDTHETVHHINGDGTDNRLENLQLRQGRHGKGVVMVCQTCGSHDVQAVEIAT